MFSGVHPSPTYSIWDIYRYRYILHIYYYYYLCWIYSYLHFRTLELELRWENSDLPRLTDCMTLSSRYFQSYTKVVSTRFEVVSLSGSGVTREITWRSYNFRTSSNAAAPSSASCSGVMCELLAQQLFILSLGADLSTSWWSFATFQNHKIPTARQLIPPRLFLSLFPSRNHGQANHCRPVIQGFLCVDCFCLLIFYKYTYLDEIQVINWVYCVTPIVHANDRSPNFTNSCKESTLQSNWPDVRESKSCVTQKTSSAIVSVNVDGRILICKVLKWAWLFRIHCGFHYSGDSICIPQRWILKILVAPFETSEKLLVGVFLPSKPRLKPGQNLKTKMWGNFTRLKDAWLTVLVGEVCEGRSSWISLSFWRYLDWKF